MFEKIHFYHIDKNGLTDKDILAEYRDYPQESPMPEMVSATTAEATYLIQGEIDYLVEQPMTEKNKEQYLYLQGFALMRMGADFYTSRKSNRSNLSYLMVYTYEGTGELHYMGKTIPLNPGDGFLIDCREEHTYCTRGNDWYHADLHFLGGNSDFLYHRLLDGSAPLFHCAVDTEFQVLLEQVLLAHTSISEFRDMEVSLALQRLLLFLAKTQKDSAGGSEIPENIRYLMRYMESNFTQDLTLDQLAEFCGITKYHLCHEFKRYTSFSPKEYLTLLRLNQAKLLLSTTDLPAYKIGMLVGIPSEANFIRLFDKNVHQTPGTYRKGSKG